MSTPLRLVPDLPATHSPADTGAGTPAGTRATAAAGPPLLRLCAGEPLLLTPAEIDLVALVNAAPAMDQPLLSPEVDPDEHRLAEVLVEHLCQHHGIDRQAKGDRMQGVESNDRRYLLPFLIELDAARPAGRRGVADLRITHLEMLPRVLSGSKPLPAATVAADLLGRRTHRAVGCVFLSVEDAGRVSHGGPHALAVALADGSVPTHLDVRTGEAIIRTADLRAAGLLIEPAGPHGLATGTAKNVLRILEAAVTRAAGHGAHIRGTFALKPIEPLPHQRLREPKPDAGRVELTTIHDLAALLPVIGQVVVWIERLVGERISEIFGLQVSDYHRDERGRGWLAITEQGGTTSLGRDAETGHFQKQTRKPHTKSAAGKRTIPIPHLLADLLDRLIAVFHTDPITGRIDWEARLIPGVGKDDAAGQSSVRGWVGAAQEVLGVGFDFHHLRATLITDLRDGGIDDRTAHYYAGHEHPDNSVQSKHYDLGPGRDLLIGVAELLDTRIAAELGVEHLWVPTAVRERWGRGTRWYPRADAIDAALVELGWRTAETRPGLGRLLTVKEAAAILELAEPTTRRLMSSGVFAAHQEPWGDRPVWMAWETDVRAYKQQISGPTLTELAQEAGWEYHQVWNVLHHLGLAPTDRAKGAHIRLTPEDADRLRAELGRREAAARDAMTVREAAGVLGFEVGTVETLLRRGELEAVPGPAGGRTRYLTRASVEAYGAAFPAQDDGSADEGDVLLTGTETRQTLRVTRPELTTLVTTRQIATGSKPRNRHVYYSAASALAWAERTGNLGAATRLRRILPR